MIENKPRLRDEQFPVTRELIYLNHAALGPLPRLSVEAMQRAAEDQMRFGALHWLEWREEYARFRQSAARLINADPAEISILKNTSEGLSFVAAGYRWQRGDNVVTTDLEFPSNFVPWKVLETKGVQCRVVRSRNGAFSVEDVEALLDERTRIVSLSSVAFHNGFAPDLESIGSLCASRGVLFCVDAIQSLGAFPLDVRAASISFLAADAHKWMLGPEGTAIFFCRAEAREHLEVLEHGWLNIARTGRFLECPTDLLEDGRRFEAGSPNTIGIYGARASLDFLQELGTEAVAAEITRLATRLAEGLEGLGLAIGSPRPIRSGIVAASPPTVDSARLSGDLAPAGVRSPLLAVHQWLERNGVVCSPREGMLRFSPHVYTSDDEIDRVVGLLASLV